MNYDTWKSTEPDGPRGGGKLAGHFRLDGDIYCMFLALVRDDDVAGFWATNAMRTARKLGMYPTTEQLERERLRRQAA